MGSLGSRTDRNGRWPTWLLVLLVAYELLVLAAWFKLDMRPPRWDESTQLLLSLHSFEKLQQLRLFEALQVTDLTLTKSGFVPFLSALTYFALGVDEQLATFVLNGTSMVLLAIAMHSLAHRLFDDALVGVAAFGLVMCSGMAVLLSHFYTVDFLLVALVALTAAAAVEIRARAFQLGGWTWTLATAMVVGIGAKHLYPPFVAAPLLVVLLDGLARMRSWRERAHSVLLQATVVLPALLLGVGYHVVNWAVIAEHLKRATTPGYFSDLGTPPTQSFMFGQVEVDLLGHLVPLALAAVPGVAVLLLARPFALAVLLSWTIGIWVVLAKAAQWPLLYYYAPMYPAVWLLLLGWLSRATLPRVRAVTRVILVGLTILSGAVFTRSQLGTVNALAVVTAAPSILQHPEPQPNPFVSFDSSAPARLDGNAAVLPYAHDWHMDDILQAIEGKMREYEPNRVFNIGLLADNEYFSGDLLRFKIKQHRLERSLVRVFVLERDKFPEVDFLITKTGDIFKSSFGLAKMQQDRAHRLLAHDGAALRDAGFTRLLDVPLPDGSRGTVWTNRDRLAVRYDLVAMFPRLHAATQYLLASQFTIHGDSRPILFTHASPTPSEPTSARFEAIVIPPNGRLKFGIALNPAVWDEAAGDGVTFELEVDDGGQRERLFTKTLDPAHRAADRGWHDEVLSLEKFSGKRVAIIATALPNQQAYFDHGGWSCLCIVAGDQPSH